jgi:hypothetical protein
MHNFYSSLKGSFTAFSLLTMAVTSWLFPASVVPQPNNQPLFCVSYMVVEHMVSGYCCVFVSRRDIVVTSGLEGFCPFTMTAFLGPVGCH